MMLWHSVLIASVLYVISLGVILSEPKQWVFNLAFIPAALGTVSIIVLSLAFPPLAAILIPGLFALFAILFVITSVFRSE